MELDDWLEEQAMSSSECGRKLKKHVGRVVNVSTISRIRRHIENPTQKVAKGIVALTNGAVTWEDLYATPVKKSA